MFVQHIEIVHQFLPSLRLDGYYVVSDLTGVPDLFERMKPVLRSLLPWRPAEKKVEELKPWARVAVTVWVLITIPVVLYLYGILLVNAPRIFATAWDSFWKQAATLNVAFAKADALNAAVSVIQILTLVLPVGGMVLSFAQTGRRLALAGWTRTQGHPLLRTGFVTLSALAVALLVGAWLPHGNNYRPIQPNDRGTVQGGFYSVHQAPAAVPGGVAPGTLPQPAATPSTEPTQPQPSLQPSSSSPQPTISPAVSPSVSSSP